MFEILKRKLQLLVGRCVINTIKNEKYQIELLPGEVRDNIEIMQHFGYKSVPPKETIGLTLSIGGVRDDTIIIATGNKTAPEVKEGESTIYNNFSERIELLEKMMILNGEVININGDSKQLVTHAELDNSLQQMLTSLNSHTHVTTATIGASPTPGIIARPTTPTQLDISSSKTTTINVE